MDGSHNPDGPGADDPGPDDPGGGTVVAPKPKAASEADKKPIPKYHVVLWDSDEHTYDYVIKMLRELFGHTKQKSFELAEAVDKRGRVIVITTTKEHAELKRDQIHAYGKDEHMRNCKGSMKATIEEAS